MAAETVQRRVDIQLTATDKGASATMSGVGNAAKSMAKDVASANSNAGGGGGAIFGPAVAPRFSNEEQVVRDKIAGRVRAMRDAARRAAQEGKVNDYLFGSPAAEKAGLPDLSEADFNRGSASRRAPGAGRNQGMLKRLSQEGENLNRLTNLVRGGGAFAVLSQLGQGLQRLPETMAKWEESLKTGGSTAERWSALLAETIPGIGDFAKGLRSLWDEIGGQGKLERQRLQDEADKKNLRETTEKRDAARKPILDAAAQGAVEARYRLRLAGKSGEALSREQAQVDLDRELRDINAQRKKVSTFGDEQRIKAESDLRVRESAAQAEYLAKVQAQDEEANKRAIEDARKKQDWDIQSEEIVRQKATEGRQLDLAEQGKYLEARMAGIKAAADEEIAQLKRKHDEEEKALLADPVTGRQASVVRDNAKRRLDAETAAVRENQKKAEKAAQDADQREREQIAQDHAGKMLDMQTDVAARRLALEGQGQKAEELQSRRAYQRRLEQIQENAKSEIQQHAEREPEIRQRAKELAEAAAGDFALTQEEIARKREESFKVGLPGGISGQTSLKGAVGMLALAAAGQAGTPADRTAKATEKANELLKNVDKGISRLEKALSKLEPVGVVSGN